MKTSALLDLDKFTDKQTLYHKYKHKSSFTVHYIFIFRKSGLCKSLQVALDAGCICFHASFHALF